MLSVAINGILLYKTIVISSSLQPHTGCRMDHRQMTLKVYDYEVSAAAMATYRESEQGPERAVSPWAKSILSYWQRTLTIASSPQTDFQCTTLLSNSDITRYHMVITRTKELVASLISSPPVVQVFVWVFFFFSKTNLWETIFFQK